MVQRSSNECIIKARSAMAKRRGQHLVPQVFPACILIPCHALVAISKRIRYARARIPREDARSGNFKQYFRIFSTLTEQCSLDTRTWRTPQTFRSSVFDPEQFDPRGSTTRDFSAIRNVLGWQRCRLLSLRVDSLLDRFLWTRGSRCRSASNRRWPPTIRSTPGPTFIGEKVARPRLKAPARWRSERTLARTRLNRIARDRARELLARESVDLTSDKPLLRADIYFTPI